MAYGKKRSLRRKTRSRRPYRRKRTRRTRKRFCRAVKNCVRSIAETKRCSTSAEAYQFGLQSGLPILPISLTERLDIPQGNQDGQRIGQRVMTKKCTLKLICRAPTPDVQGDPTAPCILQIFVGYRKSSPSITPDSTALNRLFDLGNAVRAPDGTLESLTYSINKEEFRILYYKKIKLGNADAARAHNNDFPLFRFVNLSLTKFMGQLHFNGVTTLPPTNRHLYLWATWVNPNRTVNADDVTYNPGLVWYMDYTYTDI